MNYSDKIKQAGAQTETDQSVNAIGGALSKIPVYGAIASAGVGIYNMFRKSAQMNEQNALMERQATAQKQSQYRSVLKTFPTGGIDSPSIFMGKGGPLGSPGINYKAEGKEVVMHNPSDPIKTDNAGSTNELALGISQFEGDKHSDPSGGIGASQDEGAFIFSDQIAIPDHVAQLLKRAKV